MIIREEDLRNTIREELISVMLERGNPWHDKETGKLSSGDTGNTYSISQPKSKETGLEAKKGIVTSKGKLKAKYGMPNECGRKSISGEEISPKYSCSKFKKKYSELKKESKEIGTTDITDVEISDEEVACIRITDLVDLVNRHRKMIQEQNSTELDQRCRSLGYSTFEQLIRSIDSAVKAANGEYITLKK
jgi:hypothetical protein